MTPVATLGLVGTMIRWLICSMAALAASLVVPPAIAQPGNKVYRIGYFGGTTRIHPAFRQCLGELGYVEGKNLAIEFRPRNQSRPYPVLARELVALDFDLILAVGVGATGAAKEATTKIHIVMGNSSADPVRAGLIESLARPGGNVTGVIDLLPDLAGKRVELLKEILPGLTWIADLAPGRTGVGPPHLETTKAAARALGVKVRDLTVRSPEDVERAFQAAVESGAEAIVVVGVNFFNPRIKQIVTFEHKYRLPAMHTHTRWVASGGLIAYTTNADARYRWAAEYVDRVLRGAKPADLPVEQARDFVLEVNLGTARSLGITIPRSVLLRTGRVIE